MHFFKFTVAVTCKRTASRTFIVLVTEPFFAAHSMAGAEAVVIASTRTGTSDNINGDNTLSTAVAHAIRQSMGNLVKNM